MKQYNKPSINVVELSVRENIAALPLGASVSTTNVTIDSASKSVALTTYNLAATAGDSVVVLG